MFTQTNAIFDHQLPLDLGSNLEICKVGEKFYVFYDAEYSHLGKVSLKGNLVDIEPC